MRLAVRIDHRRTTQVCLRGGLQEDLGTHSRDVGKAERSQAASWKTARHVVAKVEFHAGELFPRVGFIVTNLETPSRAVVRFYNKRGTAEQWIKEGKQAVKMTRLSCHRFRSNQVRLALSLLAYNLGNLWRELALPQRIENWSLATTTG